MCYVNLYETMCLDMVLDVQIGIVYDRVLRDCNRIESRKQNKPKPELKPDLMVLRAATHPLRAGINRDRATENRGVKVGKGCRPWPLNCGPQGIETEAEAVCLIIAGRNRKYHGP